jgi:hypothetical protein
MITGLLLIAFCGVYLPTQIHLLKVDFLFAVAYFYLFVYGIFAIVGYIYFPDLSTLIYANFGSEIEWPTLIFLILTFISLYICLLTAGRLNARMQPSLEIGKARFNYPVVAISFLALFLIGQIAGLISFGDEISYTNASDADFIERSGLNYRVWFSLYKLSPVVLTIYYSVYRYQIWTGVVARGVLGVAWIAALLTFLVASRQLGNRTDSVALLNGIIFVELILQKSRPRNVRKSFLRLTAIALSLLAFMIWVRIVRTEDAGPEMDWMRIVIFQDYFAPAHMLFAAIANNLINPLEVLTSNYYNSMILMNYPYLQEYVTDTFNPGITTRIGSYAFYLPTEGYLMMGYWGFLYNGIVVSLGFLMWRRIAATASSDLNALLLPILALDLANIARSQSSYFIKLIYFHFIPALLVIFLCTGLYIRGLYTSGHRYRLLTGRGDSGGVSGESAQ